MIVTTDDIFRSVSTKLKNFTKDSLEDLSPDQVTGVVVRLGFNLSQSILSKYKNLKFVATITTGLDHIDLEYCQKNNIVVISLKGETEFLNSITATPEHTWGLLLSLIRKIPFAQNSVFDGNWERENFFGNELAYKNLGIIGFGRVGKIIATYALAFRMNVSFYDPYEDHPINSAIKKVDLSALLQESDVISLHPPLNKDTEHLINREHFEKMQKRPFLINTSRGKIVNEKDLLAALKGNLIKGAALDVLEHEIEFSKGKVLSSLLDYLKERDNLIITPHIAGSTHESMQRTALFIESKLIQMGF